MIIGRGIGQRSGQKGQGGSLCDQCSDGEEHQGSLQAGGAHPQGLPGQVLSEGRLSAPSLQQGALRETGRKRECLLTSGKFARMNVAIQDIIYGQSSKYVYLASVVPRPSLQCSFFNMGTRL